MIIAVSDGEYTVTDSFTITVENTNRPPILQIPDKHTSEGSTLVFDLSEYASDPDGDALSFRKVSGDGELSGSVFTYTAGYEDEGDHEVVVAVSDGATEVTDTFVIHVSGSNRAPIIDIPDQEIPENSTLVLNLLEYATDPDGDSITFEKIEGPGQVTDNEYTYTTDYESAGQYTVKITVSDGVFTVEDTFVITVNDVNRAPSVEIGDQVVNEGEVLELNLEEYATDPDGDALSFTMISGVGRIEGNVYSYSPDYSDAGTYEVTIKVTDGKGGEAQDSFTITVNDVNRAPSIDVPDQSVSETQTLTINLLNYAMDPDGDSLTFEKVSGVGSIDGNIFSYTPGYDDAGTHVVTIKAIDSRGGEAQDSFTITVNDVNRAPSIEIGDQVVNKERYWSSTWRNMLPIRMETRSASP
ncbi:hypothetical protein IX53_04345 [Kosmotoga pacifica]|uniref:Cadherin domain-containing protein n=1 Tax=Kosmotoga pacifica TaxID=1330330 RepID=A0A0G2Z6I3_9BACT|nr:hypothetical protein IX53_04345 [Kosmotoga pacifica]